MQIVKGRGRGAQKVQPGESLCCDQVDTDTHKHTGPVKKDGMKEGEEIKLR